MTNSLLGLIASIVVVGVAFLIGLEVGWHRGIDYGHKAGFLAGWRGHDQ
jgi:hypothetical protein